MNRFKLDILGVAETWWPDKLTESWQKIIDSVTSSMQNKLGYKTKNKKQKWMTDEIVLLMDERRKYKNETDGNTYKDIQRLIRSKIRIAKNECLKQ
ncbi:hypothetical protein RN001_006768 [Aquatica leii]|uniref:Uncharacterized protein n=1 Tax=Aquatica leii TaxID=1421715 RepID=A0AAN7PE27_9COLE|nr:hypothetical protein RN001_006768 [Aquatica leii]